MLLKKRIAIVLLLVTIAIGSYYIKEQYFYNGHEYVGEWVADNSHMTISRQGNHFILKFNNSKFFTAHLTKDQELQAVEHKQKLNAITYLAADDAIQLGNSYYKRSNR